MAEYAASVITVSLMLGVVCYLSHPNAERSAEIALSALLIYVVLMPLFNIIGSISNFDTDNFANIGEPSPPNGGDYEKVSEKAFAQGIKKLVSEKYSLSEENIEVFVYGFDFEKMKAESVKILLSGRAVFADYRHIESYITAEGLGDCRVEVAIE